MIYILNTVPTLAQCAKIAKQLRKFKYDKLSSLKPLYLGSIMIVQFLLKCSCNRVYTLTPKCQVLQVSDGWYESILVFITIFQLYVQNFQISPGIRWMVFADVWMFIWVHYRSHGCDVGDVILSHGHVIGNLGPIRSCDWEALRVLGYWPWIPVQNHKVKIKMANDVSLSFSEFLSQISLDYAVIMFQDVS